MQIISGTSNKPLAANIAASLGLTCTNAEVKYFPNGELLVKLEGACSPNAVLVQDAATNANSRLMELLLLADAARRAGASTVTALIPYLGYSRQERALSEHGPIAMALVARMIEAAGINRVIALDLHSPSTSNFFNVEVVNLNPLHLFADQLKVSQADIVVVSPDAGSMPRARNLSEILYANFAVIDKIRLSSGECMMSGIKGQVQGKHCVLLDDIIDSATTITKAVELLFNEGASSVEVCATHGIFSGEAWRLIDSLPVERVCITDSIAQPSLPPKFKVLPVHELFAAYLKRLLTSSPS